MATERDRIARGYVGAGSLLAFVLVWSTIARNPYAVPEQPAAPEARRTVAAARIADLTRREQKFRVRARRTRLQIDRRWAQYGRAQAAAASSARIVTATAGSSAPVAAAASSPLPAAPAPAPQVAVSSAPAVTSTGSS